MVATTHSAWAHYKACLTRIAFAGARLTEARAENSTSFGTAEREFFDALLAYDLAREHAASAVPDRPGGVVLPFRPRGY